MGAARLLDRLRASRRTRYDAVFYTPMVGFHLSPTTALPAAGGAETQVLMLASALARRGHRIGIIAYDQRGDLPAEVDGVTIIAHPPYRQGPRLVGKVIDAVLIWLALWRAPAQTVVTRCAGVQVGMVALYARLARQRFVFAISNVADFEPEKLMFKRRDLVLYKLGVRLADALVVQTEEQIELCHTAFNRQPVLIKSIAAPAEPQIEEPVAFLWIGRLAPYKCPLEYVELARAVPEAHFWMVGVPVPLKDGEEGLEGAVSAASADVPNLELLSPRSHSEIGKLMSRAVASVNTADFEGMPNVLLEAWSRGVPALVLTHDPSGVITSHGLGAFASGSRPALVAAAREQWETRTQRHDLSQRCRAYVQRHHSPEVVAAQWREVLAIGAPASTRVKLDLATMAYSGESGQGQGGRF